MDRMMGSLGRPGSLNPYVYVEGNPATMADPAGRFLALPALRPAALWAFMQRQSDIAHNIVSGYIVPTVEMLGLGSYGDFSAGFIAVKGTLVEHTPCGDEIPHDYWGLSSLPGVSAMQGLGSVEPGWYVQVQGGLFGGGIAWVWKVEPVELGWGMYTWRRVGQHQTELGFATPGPAIMLYHVN